MKTYAVLKPPPEAYKYRNKGSAMEFKEPENLEEQSKKLGGTVERVEYFKDGDGILLWMKGLKYPTRGIPYPEAQVRVNGVKAMLVVWLLSFNPFTWRRAYNKFVYSAHQLMASEILEDRFLSKTHRHLMKMIGVLDEKLGEILAWVFEYDDAYGMILGDLAHLTSTGALLKRPIREIWMLCNALEKRIMDPNKGKYRAIKWLLTIGLCLPSVRKAFRKVVSGGIEPLRLDKYDTFHALYQTYYDFFGLPIEERMKIFNNENTNNEDTK